MTKHATYSRTRRRWEYRPEPMDAEECENIAACLASNDTWGDELRAAAAEIRALEAEPDDRPGVAIPVVRRR